MVRPKEKERERADGGARARDRERVEEWRGGEKREYGIGVTLEAAGVTIGLHVRLHAGFGKTTSMLV